MDKIPGQQRNRVGSRAGMAAAVFVKMMHALFFGIWGMLATYVAAFWVVTCLESVRAFTSQADSPDIAAPSSAAEAGESLLIVVVTVIAQIVVVAGIMFVFPRVRVSDSSHRLPVPPESNVRRLACTSAVFAAAALMTALAFDGPGVATRPGGNSADATARLLSEIRTLLAGLLEEPLFSMLPVLALALLPLRWTRGVRCTVALVVVIVVSACGRGVLHMYQGGWPAAAAVFWGAATVYAYYRFRSIAGLIAVHTLWNLAFITQFGQSHIDRVILISLAVLVAGFVVAVTWPGSAGDVPEIADTDAPSDSEATGMAAGAQSGGDPNRGPTVRVAAVS